MNLREFFCCARHSAFVACADCATLRVRHCTKPSISVRLASENRRKLARNQEVRRSLPILRLIAHVDEVLPRLARAAKIYHVTFVKKANLIKKVVQWLSSLVKGDDRCHASDVCSDAEGLDELQSGGRAVCALALRHKSARNVMNVL